MFNNLFMRLSAFYECKSTKKYLIYQVFSTKIAPKRKYFTNFAPIMEPKKAITISLIIPVYNVSAYIERCLKSVIKQTYSHFECIIVDDASPDDSIAKSERMIAAYNGPIQFRILHHERNRGLSAARNTGTDAATGDYILYIDSDDIISNDCVEKLMAPVLNDNRMEMVYGGWMYFSDSEPLQLPYNFKKEKKVLTTQEEVRNFFFNRKNNCIPAAWNKLVSRHFLNQYNLRFREGQLWEDVLWCFFVMKHLRYMYSITDVTYFYYKNPNSITTNTSKVEEHKHKIMISDIVSSNFTPGDEGREAAYYVLPFCHHYIKEQKRKENRAMALRFCKALPLWRHPKEKVLLWAVMALPHSQTGKEIYLFLRDHLFKLSTLTKCHAHKVSDTL